MANTKERSQAEKSQTSPPIPDNALSEDALKPFEEAYSNYFRALHEAWSYDETQKRSEEVNHKYLQALNEIGSSEDSVKRIEVYNDYISELQEAWMPKESQTNFRNAYDTYVQALLKAFSNVNVKYLGTTSLSIIGQSMVIIAYYDACIFRSAKQSDS